MPVSHSLKFHIEGLNYANQQYNAPNSFTNNVIKFNKEKLKRENISTAVFLPKFFPNISEPTLTLARRAKPRPIPILSRVHWLQSIGNICAYGKIGHSDVLGIENYGGIRYVRVNSQSSANVCKGSVSSTCMLYNDLELGEITFFFPCNELTYV